MKKTLIFLILIFCFLFSTVFAAEQRTIDVSKLSIKDAVDLAILGNYTLKSQREQLLEAIAAKRVALNLSNPSVSTSLTKGANAGVTANAYNASFNLIQDLNTGDNLTVTNTGYTQSGNGSQLLYNQFSVVYTKPLLKNGGLAAGNYGIVTADNNLKSQNLTYEISRQNIIELAFLGFYDIIKNKQQIIVNEEAVKLAEESFRIASRKLEEGLATSIDVTRTETTLANAQGNLISSQKSWKKSRDLLAVLIGLTPEDMLDIDYVYVYKPGERILDDAALIKEALTKRMNLLKLKVELDQAYTSVKYYKNQFMPNLNLVTSYNTNPDSSNYGISQSYLLPTWSINLNSTYFLRDFADEENFKKSERLVVLKKEDIASTQRVVEEEVRSSVRGIFSAYSQVNVNTKNVNAAELSLYAANRRWEEGIADNRDVMDAQQSLTQAKTRFYAAQIDYLISKVTLFKNIGVDLYEYLQKEL